MSRFFTTILGVIIAAAATIGLAVMAFPGLAWPILLPLVLVCYGLWRVVAHWLAADRNEM